MTVTAVSSAGHALRYSHQHDRLRVEFPVPSQAGESFSFTVDYHGVPATGLYIGPNPFGDRVWLSNNWPNQVRNWLATIDHISVKAPEIISVTAPSQYQVLSNGTLTKVADLPGGMRRTVWNEKTPIPSWQYSLGIAHWDVTYFGASDGVPFSAWTFPQDQQKGPRAFDGSTQSIFEFFSTRIGPYAYEKLAQAEANEVHGGTEPASTIFYGYPPNGPELGVVAHEMAHQWFGNATTESDWDQLWLSEGFATYFSLLYTEFHDGHDAFLAGVKQATADAKRFAIAYPEATIVHADLKTASNVNVLTSPKVADGKRVDTYPLVYERGAMVLHMLRGALGDKVFWSGIKLYYGRHRNGSVTIADFRHAMEDACNMSPACPAQGRDLRWFFQEWLYRGGGILHVNGSWSYDKASKVLHVKLEQGQAEGLYQMPLQLGIVVDAADAAAAARRRNLLDEGGGRGEILRTIWLKQAQQDYAIPLTTAPTVVELDPNFWVPMMQASFSGLNGNTPASH